MKKSIFIVSALVIFLLTACGAGATPIPPTAPASIPTDVPPVSTSTNVPAAATTVSFANDVSPILQSRCFDCHGGQDTKAGLSIKSYQALMAGSKNGPVIIAGDPANSLLIQLIQQGEMPKRGPKLTPDQLQILIDWITAGALNN
jgi:uncharacterized membrane protein